MTKDTSPPAFPVICENGLGHISDGMTLRQYAAIKAMQGILASMAHPTGGRNPFHQDAIDDVTQAACKYADKMVAELEKGQNDETN